MASTAEKSAVAEVKKEAVTGLTDAGDEIIAMDRVRKLIADHMVNSKRRTSPHVTTFIDVDVTDIINWRNGVKIAQSGRNQAYPHPHFHGRLLLRTLRQFPGINISGRRYQHHKKEKYKYRDGNRPLITRTSSVPSDKKS
ncbi:MAG: 2-oxo acid dehydrogenase subunit E2 [Bacteroidales bacterium]